METLLKNAVAIFSSSSVLEMLSLVYCGISKAVEVISVGEAESVRTAN
ncbi:MAG: hypothetical protein WA183_00715 [Chthoniobacterales bacterium]